MGRKKKKTLTDGQLLQIAEMKSLCKWGEERLKDLHFRFNVLLDEGTDDEILQFTEKCQSFFMILKQTGNDSETWIPGSTKSVLEFYHKEKPEIFNRLDEIFKKDGSRLNRLIYIPKK